MMRSAMGHVLSLSCLLAACALTAACSPPNGPTTTYSAVFLTNNQVYFGKLDGWATSHPVLTDVYYVQTQVNQETKEIKNTLIKRGNEWHAPDRMFLNPSQILFVEPVTDQSTVSKLIEQLNKH
jgi:hypothetical protein